MKKIGILLISLITVIALSSCKGGEGFNYDLDETALDSLIAKEWFGSEEDYSSDYLDKPEEVDPKKERIEVYAPKNVEEKAKYTIVNLEEAYYDKHIKGVYFSYCSMSALFSAQSAPAIINPVAKTFDEVVKPSIPFAEKYESWVNSIPLEKLNEFEEKDGVNRTLEVLYVPYMVKYYFPKQDSNAVHILTTFIIAPVYYELNYLADGETLVESDNLKDFTSYEITFDGTLISSKVE